MKVTEVIAEYNRLHNNREKEGDKLNWVRRCEKGIINDVIINHKIPEDLYLVSRDAVNLATEAGYFVANEDGVIIAVDLGDYFKDWGMRSDLLVEEPYTEIYTTFIDAQIAYHNMETERYQFAMDMYNTKLLQFMQRYNRVNPPIRQKKRFMLHDAI